MFNTKFTVTEHSDHFEIHVGFRSEDPVPDREAELSTDLVALVWEHLQKLSASLPKEIVLTSDIPNLWNDAAGTLPAIRALYKKKK
ncbi:hypothetical protein ACWPKO_00640 [Coraliomargarita sp. W4R53]